MSKHEQFLSQRQRYQPLPLPQEFSDEELARDWTLSAEDCTEIGKYSTAFRLFVAVQLCAVRLYGRFLNAVPDVSPRILNYLGSQLGLPPALTLEVPDRKATYTEHRRNILAYLGFQKFDGHNQAQLTTWLEQQAQPGVLPEALFQQAEQYLLGHHILLPGPSVLERLVVHICSTIHEQLFAQVFHRLPSDVRQAIDHLLTVPKGEHRSYFSRLKEYPPAATISSLQAYLQRYQTLCATGIAEGAAAGLTPAFLEYLFKLAKRYSATDLKRFADQGEFTTGDYAEIMNKASCLSLVSNAILYWNTLKITDLVDTLRRQGAQIDNDALPHISLLPFKHVVPHGTYFIEEEPAHSSRDQTLPPAQTKP